MAIKSKVAIMGHMTYIGIDPGLSGSIAVIDSTHRILLLEDFPYNVVQKPTRKGKVRNVKQADIQRLSELVKKALAVCNPNDPIKIGIEFVHPRPGEGVVSTWTFASGYWPWLAIFATLGHTYSLISPQTWKKHFKEFKKLPKDKKSSITVAKAYFPNADIKYMYQHGRADALLIASYISAP